MQSQMPIVEIVVIEEAAEEIGKTLGEMKRMAAGTTVIMEDTTKGREGPEDQEVFGRWRSRSRSFCSESL